MSDIDIVHRLHLEANVSEELIKREAAQQIACLREFARFMLVEGALQGQSMDGGDIQEKALELGLIELRPCKPEDSIDGETEHYFMKWTPHE